MKFLKWMGGKYDYAYIPDIPQNFMLEVRVLS